MKNAVFLQFHIDFQIFAFASLATAVVLAPVSIHSFVDQQLP